jgi:ArsR family transcriptional regulator, arsenate/arsenite/antimonite-responsive transcriptional repressor
MPKTLDVIDRRPGERCCDTSARPSTTFAAAERDAEGFDLLAHPVRLQLLDLLARNAGRVCVCDLEAAVPVKQPTVSHHLRLLREAGVVESEKAGVWAYYHINRPRLATLRERMMRRLDQLTAE